MNLLKLTSISALIVTLSGCTDFSHTNKQTVIVETPMVEHAECDLIDTIGNRWVVYDTPEPVTITSGYGPITLQCFKKGYKKTIVQIRERYPHEMPLKEYQYMIRSGLGFVKDIANDVGKRYPDVLVVLMEPHSFKDEEERIDWLAAKHSYEKMYQEPDRSDRLMELVQVEKNIEQRFIERQLREEVKVERELKGEAFIRRNRKITELKENISENAEIRRSLRRKLLDHYREKLGFKPARKATKATIQVTKEALKETNDTNKKASPQKAKTNIQLLKDALNNRSHALSIKRPKKDSKNKNSAITNKAIEKPSIIDDQGKDTALPISIIPPI